METNTTSNELLQTLSQIFLHISHSEKQIEIIRQRLSNIPSFDILQAFLYFDTQGNNCISSQDLLYFLNQQGSNNSIALLNHVVFFYDEEKKGSLSYSQFASMTLPNENYSLRRTARDRLWSNSLSEPIDKDVCDLVVELIESEVDFTKGLIVMINRLQQCEGFSIKSLFNLVTINGFITPTSLMKLFNSCNCSSSFDDVCNVMKRLDSNKDNKIDFNEFNSLLTICDNDNEYMEKEKERFDKSKAREWTNNTAANFNLNYSFTDKKQKILNENGSLVLRVAPSLLQHPFPNKEKANENDLANVLLMIMDSELVLEKKKCELALQTDFSIESLFLLFKSNSLLDTLLPWNILEGTKLFNIFSISKRDIQLFFRRFNLSQTGSIRYSEFFDIFIPFEKEFRDLIEQRSIDHVAHHNKQIAFQSSTKEIIKDIINKIFEYETHLESIRNTLCFNSIEQRATDLFNSIAKTSKSYITNSDIYAYFTQKKRMSCSMRECNLLHIKLDKNRNGRIELCELIDEYLPLHSLT